MNPLKHFGIRTKPSKDKWGRNLPYTVEYFDDDEPRRKGHTRWKKESFGYSGDNFTKEGKIIDKELYRAQLGGVQPDKIFSTDSKAEAEAKRDDLNRRGWDKTRIRYVEEPVINEGSRRTGGTNKGL